MLILRLTEFTHGKEDTRQFGAHEQILPPTLTSMELFSRTLRGNI